MTPLTDAWSVGSILARGDFSSLTVYHEVVVLGLRRQIRGSIVDAITVPALGERMSIRDSAK